MANPQVFKIYGDGKSVDIPSGTGEALSAIHEEVFVSILIAIYESIESAIDHSNAIQTQVLANANYADFKTDMATGTTPAAVKTITLEKGLRN